MLKLGSNVCLQLRKLFRQFRQVLEACAQTVSNASSWEGQLPSSGNALIVKLKLEGAVIPGPPCAGGGMVAAIRSSFWLRGAVDSTLGTGGL